MKKLSVLSLGLCIVLALASCKSKESMYKKAYEKAQAQEEQTTPQQNLWLHHSRLLLHLSLPTQRLTTQQFARRT